MRELKVLELFSGTRSISKAFEKHGHKTFCVDWNEDFQADLHMDIEKLTADMVLSNFGRPDVCWVSSDCATYSVQAISKHRRKNKDTGNLDPISDKAMKADRTNLHVIRLLVELSPPLIFWENPRAGLRKMAFMAWMPRYTVSYCQYQKELPIELRRQKPTDIFTNAPNPGFRPMCKSGDPCHVRAPRGSRTGTQGLKIVDKYRIPEDLCEHIVDISEDYIQRIDKANEYLVKQGLKPITAHWGEDNEPPQEPQMRLSL